MAIAVLAVSSTIPGSAAASEVDPISAVQQSLIDNAPVNTVWLSEQRNSNPVEAAALFALDLFNGIRFCED